VYAANGATAPKSLDGWTDLNAPIDVGTDSTLRVPLDTGGQRYRYYLVWITQLARDEPGQEAAAKISEIVLLERRS